VHADAVEELIRVAASPPGTPASSESAPPSSAGCERVTSRATMCPDPRGAAEAGAEA